MPFKKGRGKKAASRNIREFHKGKTYAKTKAKRGKAVADRQAVAAGMRAATMPMKRMTGERSRGEGEMESYARGRKRSSGY